MTAIDTSATAVATRFLDAVGRRDFDGIAACFAPDARFRALVPTRLREEEGAKAIAERYRFWVGELTDYEVTDTGVEEFADLIRIHYAVRGVDPEVGEPTIFEQTAYAEIADGAIADMRLVCSGKRPLG